MHHGNAGIPDFAAGGLLRVKALNDLLRASIARSSADGSEFDARMLLLKQRPQIVVHIIDHVLIASRQHGQLLRLRSRK